MKSASKSVLVFVLLFVFLSNTICSKAVKLGLDFFNGEMGISYLDYDTSIKWKVNDTYSDSSRKFIGINYNGRFYSVGEEIKVTGDAIFTLVWEPCMVVFDYGYDGSQSKVLSVDYYKSIVLPAASREGYTFDGWSDYWDDLHEAGEEVRITDSDTTFTAVWTEIPANPIITLDYGFDNKVEQFEITYGSDFVIPSESTRPGYKLTEWKVKEYYDFYRPGKTLSNVKNSLTLVAKWEEAKYTVKFDFDYKTESKTQAMQKKYKETVVMPNVDEQDGWSFIGWSDGENTYKQGETVAIENDVVFIALWEETLTKIELYTEFVNKEEPVLTSRIVQAIQDRELEFKTTDGIEFAIKGTKFKLSFDGGRYTAYFDGTDDYIVTTSKNKNIAFKVNRENAYSISLAIVNVYFNNFFQPIFSGEFIGSAISEDLNQYVEGYKCDHSEWGYLYNYDKLVKIAGIIKEGESGMVSMESYYVRSFKEFELEVDDSSVNVSENYKVISSKDSNLKLENLFGFGDADEVIKDSEGTLTLIE